MLKKVPVEEKQERGAGRVARNRIRIAWMYYVEGLTQNEIAEKLGIGRVTVVRNLNESLRQGEVKIWIKDSVAECVELETKLREVFGFDHAIVVPEPSSAEQIAKSVGFAAGIHVSENIKSGMRVGVGWGSTLYQSLQTFAPADAENIEVISLLGGIVEARKQNPAEFAWRFAQIANADCYLLAAPAVVDSLATKEALIARCGLDGVLKRAQGLDMALLSAGSMAPGTTSFRFGFIGDRDRQELLALGAVGDLLLNFYDVDGRLVDHPVNRRVMSIPVEHLRKAKRRVLASGGAKTDALRGAFKLVNCNELVTNEATARELIAKGR